VSVSHRSTLAGLAHRANEASHSPEVIEPQKTYPSSTRFFLTYFPIFKIRANNNTSWIYLKP